MKKSRNNGFILAGVMFFIASIISVTEEGPNISLLAVGIMFIIIGVNDTS